MEKINARLSKAVCCAILLLLPAFINVGQAVGAATQNVNVVNTPGVNVLNAPDVNIINNLTQIPVPVRELANPAIQPFQKVGSFTFSTGESGVVIPNLITVPQNYRIVIEYATVQGQLEVGQRLYGFITTTVSGVTAQHQLVITDQGVFAGSSVFGAAQPMRLYADPETTVSATFARDSGGSLAGGGVSITISGYYVQIAFP